jgi:pilus assembly protein Flp/PilA
VAALGPEDGPERGKVHGVIGLIAQVQQWLDSEDGATAVEYALMVALIAMAVILAVTFLGQATNQTFQDVGTAVSAT